jgi:hypothetical protein
MVLVFEEAQSNEGQSRQRKSSQRYNKVV